MTGEGGRPTLVNPAVIKAFDRLRRRLATPERWAQKIFAETKDGVGINPKSPRACRWCLVGAVISVSQGHWENAMLDILREVTGNNCWMDTWNDKPGRTHAEVLDLIDRAKARACYLAGVEP